MLLQNEPYKVNMKRESSEESVSSLHSVKKNHFTIWSIWCDVMVRDSSILSCEVLDVKFQQQP